VANTLYPISGPWYQPFLPFDDGMSRYGTAADAVFRGFDFALLWDLERRVLDEEARLERRKAA